METRLNLKVLMASSPLLLSLLLLSGCVSASPYGTLPHRVYGSTFVGYAFTNTTQPMDITYEMNSIGPSRGTSKVTNVFGLVTFGDCSVNAAARNGNLVEVNHYDVETLFVLGGLYQSMETIAYGKAEWDIEVQPTPE